MHKPRPHGLSSYGSEPTSDDLALVEALARRLSNLKNISGLESMKMVRSLPGGGYVIAQDMGGVFRAITHKPLAPHQPTEQSVDPYSYVPMLFSGVITRAILRDGEGVGIRLSEQCRRRISGYNPEGMIPPKSVNLQRFNIGYSHYFQEFEPDIGTVVFHTQYVAQRPTWYSGAMAEVMQIVGGYGRQDLSNLPEDPVERSAMKIPENVTSQAKEELAPLTMPGYIGVPPTTGQFQFDYKFYNTNGVSFDEENNPWLIRVSPAGVFAMPLPMVPLTTTKIFRSWVEHIGDEEIIKILDRFGGMPSGESFPSNSEDFEAWRRAGVIIKVCDSSDFYHHSMYSSACGWSFNSSGSEGYNTCYDYDDEEGLGYGLAYKMRLSMGKSTNKGMIKSDWGALEDGDRDVFNSYLKAIYENIGSGHEAQAIIYKIKRTKQENIINRARGVGYHQLGIQREIEYWRSLEMEPIAIHSGNIVRVSEGYLYHPASFPNQPQIKFPEPFMGGCVSHDFLPLEHGRYKDKYPNSDTIMFGYYHGNTLKVIKYFREQNTFTKEIESDFEECMIVGEWSKTERSGGTRILGNFYTSDIDERDEVSAVETTTIIKGSDRGYDSKPRFAFNDFFSQCGTVWRLRHYQHETTTKRTEGRSLSIAVCVPYLNRNTAIHAKKQHVTGTLKTVNTSLHSVTDPNSYQMWTYDFVFAWTSASCPPERPRDLESKDGNPVWAYKHVYSPGGCSDFADQGEWLGGLPSDITWLVHPKRNEWNHSGGGSTPKLKSVSIREEGGWEESGDLKYSFNNEVAMVHQEVPHNWYFLGSPDEFLGVFYRDGAQVLFGDAVYYNISESDGEGRKRWGFTELADHKSAHHFIGVINE